MRCTDTFLVADVVRPRIQIQIPNSALAGRSRQRRCDLGLDIRQREETGVDLDPSNNAVELFPSWISTPRGAVEVRRLPDDDRWSRRIRLRPIGVVNGDPDDLARVGQIVIELVVSDGGRLAPGTEGLRVPPVPLHLGAGDIVIAGYRDLPLAGSRGGRYRIRMRAVVCIGK